jgi:hypothetical protein
LYKLGVSTLPLIKNLGIFYFALCLFLVLQSNDALQAWLTPDLLNHQLWHIEAFDVTSYMLSFQVWLPQHLQGG